MSRPENPLSHYRSYSYYHVLVVCDSSETADNLAKETNADKWLHPESVNTQLGQDDTFNVLGRYAVKYVDEKAKMGKYCVLINGATDAAFTIVRAKWTSATAAAATVMDRSTSIAIEGEMEISEPKGIVFLDTLVTCCLGLGIDAANAVFMLKSFFVGYPDRGDASTDFETPTTDFNVNDIEPIRFIAYDITGSFAETGGLYKMNFVALSHGVSRLPQFGKAASGFSFTGGSLSDTFDSLSAAIKRNYNILFKCVSDTVAKTPIKDLISEVEYSFELEDGYKESRYQVNDQQAQAKDKAGCPTAAKIKISANMSIEDAIHLIMRQCPEVTKDMSIGVTGSDGKTIRFEYKIHTTVESKPFGPKGQIKYKVRYLVKKFMRPKDVSLFELAGGTEGQDLSVEQLSSLQAQLDRNTIVFDYIYTGKNIDILEFDMKMNMGMAYLQIATINNTLKDRIQTTPSSVTHLPLYDQQQLVRFGKPTQIPIFFGTQVRSPSLRNKQDISNNAEAGYTMSKHASIEVQDVTMKIYGNPRLISTINRMTGPSNLGVEQPIQNTQDIVADFRDWSIYPSFAKVNIKMPRNNDDISLFRGDAGPNEDNADFTKDFWFTGYYYVVGIEHVFEQGEFTQTLSMIGIPQSKAFKAINKQGQNNQELEMQKAIQSCYGAQVDPCGKGNTPSPSAQPTQSEPAAIPTPPPVQSESTPPSPTTAQPTNAADSAIVLKTIDPTKVQGWNTADPKVQNAILSASKKHNVDPGFMAAMASQESSFKPTIVNPLSGATGVYQFTNSSWFGDRPGYGMVTQFGKQLGLEGKTAAEQSAARLDPNVSAEGAALIAKQNEQTMRKALGSNYQATSADLYLAHFAGPKAAGDMIALEKAGNGNVHPREVFNGKGGQITYKTFITQNPEYAKYNTVKGIRDANATALATRANGMPVVQSNRKSSQSPQPSSSGSQGTQPNTAVASPKPQLAVNNAAQEVSASKGCTAAKKAEKPPVNCNQTAAGQATSAQQAAVSSNSRDRR